MEANLWYSSQWIILSIHGDAMLCSWVPKWLTAPHLVEKVQFLFQPPFLFTTLPHKIQHSPYPSEKEVTQWLKSFYLAMLTIFPVKHGLRYSLHITNATTLREQRWRHALTFNSNNLYDTSGCLQAYFHKCPKIHQSEFVVLQGHFAWPN